MADNDDLLDYEDEEQTEQPVVEGSADAAPRKDVKGAYVSIHSSGFRDFLLKPEILRAIVDCGFEHPSEGKCYEMIYYTWSEILCLVFLQQCNIEGVIFVFCKDGCSKIKIALSLLKWQFLNYTRKPFVYKLFIYLVFNKFIFVY